MTPQRTVVVSVAVAVGVLVAALSYIFLNDAQTRADEGAKLTPAYVVARPVPDSMHGADAISGRYFKRENVPATVRPASAVTVLTEINGKESVASLSVGQVLVTSMFVSPSTSVVSFSRFIPAGHVAVTVSLDPVHSVAGLAVIGNKVDLLITLNGEESSLLQNVPILAIGHHTSQSTNTQVDSATPNTQPNTSDLYTFVVTPSQAIRLAFAQQESYGLYMLLVHSGSLFVSATNITGGSTNGVTVGPTGAVTITGSTPALSGPTVGSHDEQTP